jgi:acetylornithine deacetylase/succinyl-diaminopimelate desuccinylase-like protein/pimeloyl-ACP methyl ester carboxylesterase
MQMLATTRYAAHSSVPADALPLVLVHGLSGEQAAWADTLDDARGVGDVITIDLPGFGRSPEPDEWTMTSAAEQILATLDALGIDRFLLVGHSLGGGIVLHLAALHPARAAGVLAIAPAGWIGRGRGGVSDEQVRMHRLQRRIVGFGGKQLLRVPMLRDQIFGRLVADPSKLTQRQALELANGWVRGRSTPHALAAVYEIQLLDDLPKLTMPVHLIWGTADRVVPASLAQARGGWDHGCRTRPGAGDRAHPDDRSPGDGRTRADLTCDARAGGRRSRSECHHVNDDQLQPPITLGGRFADIGPNAVELARALIRVDTSNPPGRETVAARVLQDWLAAHGVESELVGPDPERKNLVATVPGRGDGPSLALCGHLDVVPAGDPSAWKHPAFAGVLDEDGFVWGRGAVDMKAQVATRAAALVALVQSGVTPAGDVRLIAQADEEVNTAGVGMRWLVEHRRDLRTDWALEEGGGRHITLPDGRVAVLYGVADKALLPIELHARGAGGHASNPGAITNPVLTLARLLAAAGEAEIVRDLVPAADRMLRGIVGAGAPEDVGELVAAAQAAVPELAASIDAITRTTFTPTMLTGSQAVNVVPDHAAARIDCRVLPGRDHREAVARLREFLEQAAQPGDEWELVPAADPVGGSASDPDDAFTAACEQALERVDGRKLVMVPTMNSFYTDASHLRREWNTVTYGLWPWKHTTPADYQAGVHAPNERVLAADIEYAARWHLELLLEMAEG